MSRKFIIFIIILFIVQEGYSQISSSLTCKYPDLIGYKTTKFVQLTLQSGFTGPINPYFASNYYPSGNMGFDFSYRINREVALYSEVKYNFLSSKDSIFPSAGYLESTIGARYYVRPTCCRSSIFFEAGFGPYVYFQGSSGEVQKQVEVRTFDPHGSRTQYTTSTITINQSPVYESQTNIRLGANIGIGGELVLTNSLFITIKTKLNTAFEANGNTSYITGLGGFTIRL
jgi:hypothetical protein